MLTRPISVLVKIKNICLIDIFNKYKNILLTILSYDVPQIFLFNKLNIKFCNIVFHYNRQ